MRPQQLAVRLEIAALRRQVEELRYQLIRENIFPNAPSASTVSAWQLQLSETPSWNISPQWQSLYPGQTPNYDPNPPLSRVMYPPEREESPN